MWVTICLLAYTSKHKCTYRDILEVMMQMSWQDVSRYPTFHYCTPDYVAAMYYYCAATAGSVATSTAAANADTTAAYC